MKLLPFLLAIVPVFAQPQVALTFDDLPDHGPLPAGMTRVDVAKRVIAALKEGKAPEVYGMVNAKQLEEHPADVEVLKLWRAAGFPLGNHSYSHMDLNTNSAEAFEKDVALGEPVLRELMGDKKWHWLRYPFLNEGDSPAKKKAVSAYLAEHGYKVAEVTLSFADYLFNDPYTRCVAKNDNEAIEQLKATYLKAAARSLLDGQEKAKLIWGRDIKHVMLLHIGSFEAVMVPHLLDLLKEKGFRLVTLEDAESDPAYQSETVLESWRGTFLDQMMATKKLKRPAAVGANPVANLDQVCR